MIGQNSHSSLPSPDEQMPSRLWVCHPSCWWREDSHAPGWDVELVSHSHPDCGWYTLTRSEQ